MEALRSKDFSKFDFETYAEQAIEVAKNNPTWDKSTGSYGMKNLISGGKDVNDKKVVKALGLMEYQMSLTGKSKEQYINNIRCLDAFWTNKAYFTPIGKVIRSCAFDHMLNKYESYEEASNSDEISAFKTDGFSDDDFDFILEIYFKVRKEPFLSILPFYSEDCSCDKCTSCCLRIPQIICLWNALFNFSENFKRRVNISTKVPKKNREREGFSERLQNIFNKEDGEITKEDRNIIIDEIDGKNIIAKICHDKLYSTCRTGKSIMMMLLAFLPLERVMDINEVKTPYCYIKRTPDDKNPIPFYNPSCLFSSYVKDAVISVSNLFNVKKIKGKKKGTGKNKAFRNALNKSRRYSDLNNIDERETGSIESDFKTFCNIFEGIFFRKPPDWVYGIVNGSKIIKSHTWIHFLVSNSSADVNDFNKKLFIFSTIHCVHKVIEKEMSQEYDLDDDYIKSIMADFGRTFWDEDDIGSGLTYKKPEDLSRPFRVIVSAFGKVSPASLAISGTGKSDGHRIFMRYTPSDSMRDSVILKTKIVTYRNDIDNDSESFKNLIYVYLQLLESNKDVEARNLKGMIAVDSVETANELMNAINTYDDDGLGIRLPMGLPNPDGNKRLKSVVSTTNDEKENDILRDFLTDDNHLLIVVNKGGRGYGGSFIKFLGIQKRFGQVETMNQFFYRASVPVTFLKLLERSQKWIDTLSPEDKESARQALLKLDNEQVATIGFPEKNVFDRTTKICGLLDVICDQKFEIRRPLLEEYGMVGIETCPCCDTSMMDGNESLVRKDSKNYHLRCVQKDKDYYPNDYIPVPMYSRNILTNDMDIDQYNAMKWGYTSSDGSSSSSSSSSAVGKTVTDKTRKELMIEHLEYLNRRGELFKCGGCKDEMYPDLNHLNFSAHKAYKGNDIMAYNKDNTPLKILKGGFSNIGPVSAEKRKKGCIRTRCEPLFIGKGANMKYDTGSKCDADGCKPREDKMVLPPNTMNKNNWSLESEKVSDKESTQFLTLKTNKSGCFCYDAFVGNYSPEKTKKIMEMDPSEFDRNLSIKRKYSDKRKYERNEGKRDEDFDYYIGVLSSHLYDKKMEGHESLKWKKLVGSSSSGDDLVVVIDDVNRRAEFMEYVLARAATEFDFEKNGEKISEISLKRTSKKRKTNQNIYYLISLDWNKSSKTNEYVKNCIPELTDWVNNQDLARIMFEQGHGTVNVNKNYMWNAFINSGEKNNTEKTGLFCKVVDSNGENCEYHKGKNQKLMFKYVV